MCFPSKKQKNNFADSTDKAAKSKTDTRNGEKPIATTKDEPVVASEQPSAPLSTSALPAELPPTLPPISTVETSTEMAGPKVAIVIYTMYGHIAKCAFSILLSTQIFV